MTDSVIAASGQTYERAFIRRWLYMGLNICPKTRKLLTHTNLIPNYTVKALIANWYEINNVKLPEPTKSLSSNHSSPLQFHTKSGMTKERTNQAMVSELKTIGFLCQDSDRIWWSSSGSDFSVNPRSTSPSAIPSRMAGDRLDLDMGKFLWVMMWKKAPLNLDERSSDALDRDKRVMTSHKRAFSASSSSALTYASIPHEKTSGSAHVDDYASDASGEMKPQLQDNSPLIPSLREHEFPLQLVEIRSRSQTIWHRPSDRLIPRIVSSSSVETRANLSGIESQVKKLVEDLKSNSEETQRTATSDLRLLAIHGMDNRIVIANSGSINLLVRQLSLKDAGIQENSVTALLNLLINDNNKIVIANAEVIEPLIHVLQTGNAEAKENASATLFSLSVIEDNKFRIGRPGAIDPLVDLLSTGTPQGEKDAATALFNLSLLHENKPRIVLADTRSWDGRRGCVCTGESCDDSGR